MTTRAKRHFAQHFLESPWAERLVRLVNPQLDETILEIGPGRGEMTLSLAQASARVLAVEIDHDLVSRLESENLANLRVISADFLKLDVEALLMGMEDVRVVGNLPYSVGSQILVKLLRLSGDGQRFRDAVLMLQREVADRVTSRSGTKDWGPLGVATRLHADAARVLSLPPGAFRPMPKVASAVVALRFRPAPVPIQDRELFDRMVRTMFTQRRKTALNALRPFAARTSPMPPEEVFERAGIDSRRRPGDLGLAELADLSEVLRLSAL